MRFRFKSLTLIMLAAACNGVQFNDKEQRGDTNSQVDRNSSENESADEPIMVGGAYLACVSMGDQSSESGLGCALIARNNSKHDLSRFTAKWQVLDKSNQPMTVTQELGQESDPYHIKFQLQGIAYQNYQVNLLIQLRNEPLKFSKPLNELDKDFTYPDEDLRYVAKLYFKNHVPANCQDSACAVRELVQQISPTTKLCSDGFLAKSSIKNNTHLDHSKNRFQQTPTILALGPEGKCVLDKFNYDGAVYPAVHGGCFGIPYLMHNGEVVLYMIEAAQRPPGNFAQALLKPYLCK